VCFCQMVRMSTGHMEGDLQPLYLLLTDCYIYLLRKGGCLRRARWPASRKRLAAIYYSVECLPVRRFLSSLISVVIRVDQIVFIRFYGGTKRPWMGWKMFYRSYIIHYANVIAPNGKGLCFLFSLGAAEKPYTVEEAVSYNELDYISVRGCFTLHICTLGCLLCNCINCKMFYL